MTEKPTDLLELVNEWRAAAAKANEHVKYDGNEHNDNVSEVFSVRAVTLARCADDLTAALSAQGAPHSTEAQIAAEVDDKIGVVLNGAGGYRSKIAVAQVKEYLVQMVLQGTHAPKLPVVAKLTDELAALAQGGAHEPTPFAALQGALADDKFCARCEGALDAERYCSTCFAAMQELAHRASGGAQGWEPIATAPKDGTSVLLWWPHWSRQAMVGWFDKFGRWASEIALSEGTDPTHWMPLPPAPTGEQK